MQSIQRLSLGAELARGLADPGNWQPLAIALRARKLQTLAHCPLCDHKGPFKAAGTVSVRMNAACPNCGSVERNRLLKLAIDRGKIDFSGRRILHFAPEATVRRLVDEADPAEYLSVDIDPARAMRSINIEQMDLPDAAFDLVICSHVLEHVDHHKALAEIARVLEPGGLAVLLFPVIHAWEETYEDARVTSAEERTAHFGQDDHIKYFGRDVADHIRNAGFDLELFVANGPDSARHALQRGETIFLATKPH